jgi:predicted component of type VI protein secretion system
MGEPAKTQSQPCGYALRCLADGKIYPIHDGFAIGRAFGDLILANVKELSSRHCKFMLSEAGVLIQDLKSTNGVYVNQMKVAQGGSIRVPEGGLIELGPLHFELLITDTPVQAPAPKPTPAEKPVDAEPKLKIGGVKAKTREPKPEFLTPNEETPPPSNTKPRVNPAAVNAAPVKLGASDDDETAPSAVQRAKDSVKNAFGKLMSWRKRS